MPRPILVALGCALLIGFGLPVRAERNLSRTPGTTRYAAMVQRLKGLAHTDAARGAHRLTLESIGRSVKGRSLWMVTLRDPSANPRATHRVFYICRIHGHEPASTEAALQFITDMVSAAPDSRLAALLKAVIVYVVPMANPDGAERFLRHNAHDVDLNRDWMARTQPEIRALYHVIARIRPDVIADQHEMYPDDPRGDLTEVATFGSGAPDRTIAICRALQDYVFAAMAAAGNPTTEHWVDDTHPARLTHRYWAVRQGIPAILMETQRLQGSGRSVAMRAAAHRKFMEAVLSFVADGMN